MKFSKLNGKQSTIKLSLEHPIHLDEDKTCALGILTFYSDNFISNISQNIENAFRFSIGKSGYAFPIFCNQYSIQDLENRFREV